jgi:hypothetical protein
VIWINPVCSTLGNWLRASRLDCTFGEEKLLCKGQPDL